jgi:hypothetical protein
MIEVVTGRFAALRRIARDGCAVSSRVFVSTAHALVFASARSRAERTPTLRRAPGGVRKRLVTSRSPDPSSRRIPDGPFDARCLSASEPTLPAHDPEEKLMTLGTILLIVLVLMLIGAIPTWSHSRSWGYGPSGGLGLVLVIVVVLVLLGRL